MRPATWDSRLPGSRKRTESPRALLALVWRTLREDAAGRPVRLAVALWFVVQLAIVLVVVWHWTGAGVDGILSQRATPDGFVITQVRPGATVDLAGLQPGDRIVARDGVHRARPGRPATFATWAHHLILPAAGHAHTTGVPPVQEECVG